MMTPDKLRAARRMYDQCEMTVTQIATILGVSRTTAYRALTIALPDHQLRGSPECHARGRPDPAPGLHPRITHACASITSVRLTTKGGSIVTNRWC